MTWREIFFGEECASVHLAEVNSSLVPCQPVLWTMVNSLKHRNLSNKRDQNNSNDDVHCIMSILTTSGTDYSMTVTSETRATQNSALRHD